MALKDEDDKDCIKILSHARQILKRKFKPGAYISGYKFTKIQIVIRPYGPISTLRSVAGCDAIGSVALVLGLYHRHLSVDRRLDFLYGIEHYLQQASIYLEGLPVQEVCDRKSPATKGKIDAIFALAIRSFRDKSRSPDRRHPSHGAFGR